MSLVISGAKATYRGVGTVNGKGSHKFLVSAIDGDVNGGGGTDKFRIKIYADGSSSEVLYDNQMGASDNADAITVLGGGSIVIHTKKTKSAEIATAVEPEIYRPEFKVYPNPFSERLRIEFVSQESTHGRIDLFNMTGQLVKTVFNQPVKAGVLYHADFVPETEVSNFYIYRMTLGNSVQVGKVIYRE